MTSLGQFRGPGFQASETTGCEIIFYRQKDPIILTPEGVFPLDGTGPVSANPSLISCSTSKTMGRAAGTWTAQFKVPSTIENFFTELNDDDWVDVVFTKNGRRFLAMRGLVDSVRRVRQIAGNGATTEQWTVNGRDFGKIYEATPLTVDIYDLGDETSAALSYQLFGVTEEILRSREAAVRAFLYGFFEETGNLGVGSGNAGRRLWTIPPTVPNTIDNSVAASVEFFTQDLDTSESLAANNPVTFLEGAGSNGRLWDTAQQVADPDFTELFVDVLNGATSAPNKQDEELPPEDAIMSVIYRDRPHPTLERSSSENLYFNLREYVIPRQEFTQLDVGRNGDERFNFFVVSAALFQEQLDNTIGIQKPLRDNNSISKHGIRRYITSTDWVPQGVFDEYVQRINRIARDWYAVNPYLLSGRGSFGSGRPDIRIGTRLVIPGDEPAKNEQYYIEQVDHNWSFGPGLRTNVSLTRGFRGTEKEYFELIEKIAGQYVEPGQPTPAAGDYNFS